MAITFEDILPWGTTGGDTGLSARLKLKRNFGKIKTWIDSMIIPSTGPFTIWGQTYWQNGQPKNVTGSLDGVEDIYMSGKIVFNDNSRIYEDSYRKLKLRGYNGIETEHNLLIGTDLAIKTAAVGENGTDLLAYKSGDWGGVTGAHWFVGVAGVDGFIRSDGELKRWADNENQYTIWDSSNLTPSNYLPLTGGTLKGALTFADSNGNAYGAIRAEKIGNDEYLYLWGNDGVLIDGLSVRKDNAIVPIEDVFLNLTGGMMEPGATITLQEVENNIPVQTLVASQRWVNAQGFLTSSAMSGYATTSQLNTGLAAKQNKIHFLNRNNNNTDTEFSYLYLPLMNVNSGYAELDCVTLSGQQTISGAKTINNVLTVNGSNSATFALEVAGAIRANTGIRIGASLNDALMMDTSSVVYSKAVQSGGVTTAITSTLATFGWDNTDQSAQYGYLDFNHRPKVGGVNVALVSDLSGYLPLSGGSMTGNLTMGLNKKLLFDEIGGICANPTTLMIGGNILYIQSFDGKITIDSSDGTDISKDGTKKLTVGNDVRVRTNLNLDVNKLVFQNGHIENTTQDGGYMRLCSASGQFHFHGETAYGTCVAAAFTQQSDARLKEVTEHLTPDIEDIAAAPIVAFRWRGGDGNENLGTLAQYWQTVLPQAVHEDADGHLSVEYGTIALASAVTAARKVMELERRVALLESR